MPMHHCDRGITNWLAGEGELSIFAKEVVLLTPCLRMLPTGTHPCRMRPQEDSLTLNRTFRFQRSGAASSSEIPGSYHEYVYFPYTRNVPCHCGETLLFLIGA